MLTSLCSRPECWQGELFRNRICGWYWRSRPPIRINDISSWSYDIGTMDFMNTVNWNGFENFFIDIPVANELYMLKMIFQRKKHATSIISVLCFGKFSQRHVWAYSFHPMRRFWWQGSYSHAAGKKNQCVTLMMFLILVPFCKEIAFPLPL